MRKKIRDESAGRALLTDAVMRHPRETMATFAGIAAVGTIFVNALFLQHGPHPAPFFAAKPAAAVPASRAVQAPVRQVGTVPIRSAAFEPAAPMPTPIPVARQTSMPGTHDDPIGDLISGSKRLVAVQRALSEFGYGQIKPNGQMSPETEQAIARFEREHKMPVTGQMSDRLAKALATMTGRAID